jgi:hypothetical protein
MMVVCDCDHTFVKHLCFDHIVEMCTGYDRMFACIGFDHNCLWGMCFDHTLGKSTSFEHMVAHPLQILVAFVYLCVQADQGQTENGANPCCGIGVNCANPSCILIPDHGANPCCGIGVNCKATCGDK